MRILRILPLVTGVLLFLSSAAYAETYTEPGEEASNSSASLALAEDLAIGAHNKGWTFDQAFTRHQIAEKLGQVKSQIRSKRPNQVIGGELSSQPDGAPILYITGLADKFILDTVAAAGTPITIVDNQPFTFEELENRSHKVHEHLLSKGFKEIGTGFKLNGQGRIDVTIKENRGSPVSVSELRTQVTANTGVPVSVTVIDSAGRSGTLKVAHGGQWMLTNGANMCTSGWSVINDNSTSGIATAGHCPALDQIRAYNSSGAITLYPLTHVKAHQGAYGDVEWKTTTGTEPDNFWPGLANGSGLGTLRDVAAVEARGDIEVGEQVCVFGRASYFRFCRDVLDVSYDYTWPAEGIPKYRMVRMTFDDDTIGGDSGGGWSNGTKAYGSVVGEDLTDHALFSVADLYDEAVGGGVRVKTSP